MDIAESTHDPEIRARNLTFVVVGGGYAGIEALGELEDMSRYATRYYRTIKPGDLKWVLVEASDRILPEVGTDMGLYTLEQLRKRGIACHLGTRLNSVVGGHVVLSTGEEMDTETLVWTAGVKPHPLVAQTGFRLDEKGRLIGRATLQVAGFDDAWIAGDAAAIPDLASGPGMWTSPSAQHAVRQAKVLADNVIATLRGFPAKDYHHKHVGSVASLGLYKGVAQVYGIKLKGFAGLVHAPDLPHEPDADVARKVQVLIDWTQAFFFRREIVSLWGMHEPFQEFQEAAGTTPPPAPKV